VPTDFILPELGEGISIGDVLRVLVKPGDTIAKDQAVLELETDKATIEVPSSIGGQVKDVKVKPGDKVKVGQAIISVESGEAEASPKPQEDQAAKAGAAKPEAKPAAAAKAPERVPDMQTDAPVKNESTAPDKAGVKDPTVGPQAQSAPAVDRGTKVVDISRGARATSEPAAPEIPPAPAAPSVRRMARELGVDINGVPGSGPSGRISVDDVKAHAKGVVSGAASATGAPSRGVPLPDF